MKILVSNRQWITDFSTIPDLAPHIIISITDPGTLPAIIRPNFQNKGTLRLEFEDIDAEEPEAMTEAHAEAIAKFVNEHKDSVDMIVVHCEAGVSRSAGVAAAIGLVLNGDDKQFFTNPRFCPNMWCYRLVLDAFGFNITPEDFEERVQEMIDNFRKKWDLED